MALQDLSVLHGENMIKKYPGLKDYKACQSRALMKGMLGVLGGGVLGMAGAKILQQYKPLFPAKYNIVFASGISMFFGYTACAHATGKCKRLYTEAQWVRLAEENRQRWLNNEDYQAAKAESEKDIVDTNVEILKKTKYGDAME